jgi:hypothetical protein
MAEPLLTIGMATYDDYDGVYFTLQALRAYHDLNDVELLVVDNLPNGCPHTKSAAEWAKARYLHRGHATGTSLPRQLVFEEAQGEWVMCVDSHVLLTQGVVAKTKEFIRSGEAGRKNLYQGPLLYDDHINMATHFNPTWRDSMYGTWATDERVKLGEPFPIPMQGLGQFMMCKEEWPGFNTLFRGFGGEEGYIHSKVRKFGGEAMCVPWMTWLHRFGRPKGVPYRLFLEDRIFNYVVGRRELGLSYEDVVEHFRPKVPEANFNNVLAEAEAVDPNQGVFPERFRTIKTVRRTLPCFHRSSTPIDTGDCNCPLKFVYKCELHEKCRPFRDYGDGIRCCQNCNDYEEV